MKGPVTKDPVAGEPATSRFGALREQLADAATAFADSPDALTGILAGMVDDVDRALAEELEIFPVCHHSPSSALAMVRRLREKQPKVIYLELCEDLQPLLTELRNCELPVALQAFASELDGFPAGSGPLSVIAPITEASAEYQAIAYALETPGVELLLVDRSADHIFQWQSGPDRDEPPAADAPATDAPAADAKAGDAQAGDVGGTGDPARADEKALHGDAVGVEIGDLRPGFAELEAYLLHHGKVRHWSEWWDQYVEQPLIGADHDTYRQVMVMIGSLFRRLRPSDTARADRDEDRERYMWTRMREHLAASGADPADCLYVCGAFHAASRVEQFGVRASAPFEITARTATKWRYGLIPSSHSAIEAQFGLAGGAVSIATVTWQKALTAGRITPYRLAGQAGGRKRAVGKPKQKAGSPKSGAPTAAGPAGGGDRLSGFLATPARPGELDEAELLGWSVDIVRLARRNGYLASTADAIAVVETAVLLAGMRNRRRPTPYDFADAAVTCIEKDVVPGRRDIQRLCEIMFGGDRLGRVGYDALPPLARDVHDRLAPLGLDLQKRTVQRALLDLHGQPQLRPCSDLLWMLRRLLPPEAVRPIMGERRLGEHSVQESWDVAIGRHQRSIIELGYEGVTIEQVLEQRLRKAAWDPQATAAKALAAVEDSLLYLDNRRFTDELGARAVQLLAAERTVDDAPEVLHRIRQLLAYYRTSGAAELPAWCQAFVTTGYAHYCTLLPTAFVDDGTGLRQVAAMLGFLMSMESLAMALGCDRAQLELAVRQCHPQAPAKVALLWAAQSQLGQLPLATVRARCADLMASPLTVGAFPRYLSGFVQALEPVPTLAPFVVEVLSAAFGQLPDRVLLPWLPTLLTTLREQAGELLPVLVREAGRTFPATLPALDSWTPPWAATAAPPPSATGPAGTTSTAGPETNRYAMTGPVPGLLVSFPQAGVAVADLLDCAVEPPEGTRTEGSQTDPSAAGSAAPGSATADGHRSAELAALIDAYPMPAGAVSALLGVG